mgnify:CR=1 FL=1
MATIEQRLKNPRDRVYLPELLKHISKMESQEEKVLILREFANRNAECLGLAKDFMQFTWHPKIKWMLPEGTPPYRSDYPDYSLAPSTLSQAIKKFKYLVECSTMATSPIKREQIFIQLLESMYTEDSKLMIMMKEQKIDQRVYRGVTEDLFRAAFAGWLPPKENPTKDSV